MQSRLWLVFGVVCVLFVVLIIRLMYIEYSSGEKYEKIVLSQQGYANEIIPFQRGDIVDRKGTVLATSVDVYNVVLDCKVLNQYPDMVDSTIDAVTEYFPEITKDQIKEALSDRKDSQYEVLLKKVDNDTKEAFELMADEDANKEKIKGIWFEKEYMRSYPYGTLGASLIGYCSNGNTGALGIESQYNGELNGANGRRYGYYGDNNSIENTVIQPEDGKTVVSTIDVNVQSIVEQEILNWNEAHKGEGSDGSLNTACIVMNPSNGEVLAMASYPGFDLNNPRDLSTRFTPEQLQTMPEEQQVDELSKLWTNFCVSSTYEPGSTFKPFTVAIGLENGNINGDETYMCDGKEVVSGHEIHCVNRDGHGILTVEGSLMESCNDALMQMAAAIGADTFSDYQSVFGFGQKTTIDLPNEASTKDLIYTKEELRNIDSNLATNSFGQNFNVTMIQLASSYCSLINGGNLYKPHVVEATLDQSNNKASGNNDVVLKKTVSTDVSDMVKKYMLHTVTDGTAKGVQVEGYNIGGKTGTAEKLPREHGNYLVSFIGFAPYNNPQLVIYTIIDQPNVEDQAHSSYAQEITKNILDQILPYLNIDRVEEDVVQE
ncbi:MAG: penicillin-binding protein 2 [Lachnospiraceae bacterium]|nr:penicillin-binding protein 2 [Lachnospiraceae bacterium]